MQPLVQPLVRDLSTAIEDMRATTSGGAVATFVTGYEVMGDKAYTTSTAIPVSMPSNGWSVRVTTSLGTITACDPTQMVLTVTDFGWATDGSQTSWSRTVTGTSRLLRGYPDYSVTDADQAAGVIEISLDQQLYKDALTDVSGRAYTTAITGVSFGAGFANTSSPAGTLGVSITRSDSHAYPLPIATCVDYPNQRMGPSNTIQLEWAVVHEWAQKGAQLACVEAWARQSAVDGTVVRATSMTESRWTSAGSPPSTFHQPVYSTLVSGGSFVDGAATVRATFKPWIGPCTNTYDTGYGDTGVSQNLLADWPFVRDVSAGKYSPLYAWVLFDGSGLATGTAGVSASSADPGTLAVSNYATLVAAEVALQAANNAAGFRGSNLHNDSAGGVIMLRDVGTSVAGANLGCYSIRTSMGVTAGAIPLEIRAAAGVTSQLCRMRGINSDGTASTQKGMAKNVKFTNIYFDSKGTADTAASNNIWDGGSSPPASPPASWQVGQYHIFQDCYMEENSYTPAANGTIFSRYWLRWDYRVKEAVYVGSPGIFSGFAGHVLSIGSLYIGNGLQSHSQSALLASDAQAVQLPPQSIANAGVPTTKHIINYNSRWANIASTGTTTWQTARVRTQQLIGMGWCGFLVWRGGTAASGSYAQDHDNQLSSMKNLVMQHVAIPSGSSTAYRANTRGNLLYNDAGAVRIDKEGVNRFSIFAASANKEGGFGSLSTVTSLASTLYSGATQYYQGDLVFDAGTATTGNTYQAISDNIGVALATTATWLPLGVMGSTTFGARPKRVGNWRYRYQVNCLRSFNGGSVQGGASDFTPGTDSWLTILRCPGTPGTGWGGTDMTTGLFQNDTCGSAATLATLGDYRPLVSSPLRSQVPSGMAVDPFDMRGQARPNDGTGAAGALEYS